MRFSSFYDMLAYWANRTPDAPALIYDDGRLRQYSFRETLLAIEQRIDALRNTGKTCLGVLSDGSADCVLTIFAAVRAGMQIVLLDENLPESTLSSLIAYTDVDMLFGDEELKDTLAPSLTGGVRDGAGKLLFFTSGTTELAKAVVLTEESLCASAYNGGAKLPLQKEDRLLCMLPLGHVFGFVCGLLWPLSCGASVALGRGARHYADDCKRFSPTAMPLVPLLLGFLLTKGLLNPELSLVLVGAGDCPAALLAAANARGIRVSFGYGLTETSSGVAISVSGDPFAMEICPDDTITIAADGEILIHAPTCMMQGYYKRETDTAAILREGILYTGDLGHFDESGKLHVTGRKKDILVLPDGTKIFCAEYEAALSALLREGELAVALSDNRPVLFVHGVAPDEAALWRTISPFQASRPRGQQIARIVFCDAPLPRTATGKIKRWALQQEVGNEPSGDS